MSDGFAAAAVQAAAALEAMAIPVSLSDRDALIRAASTSLSSKVVANYSSLLAPMAVDAVLRVLDPARPAAVDLRDVRVLTKVGGTIDDSRLIDGVVFDAGASKGAGGPTRVENARIALIQFCLSPPKTDLENSVVVGDYAAMDRVLRDERAHILGLVKAIRACGANVVLVQKSILRDATTDLALHYLAKVSEGRGQEGKVLSLPISLSPIHPIPILTPASSSLSSLSRPKSWSSETSSGTTSPSWPRPWPCAPSRTRTT